MIELHGKKLCENCFSEINEQPCPCCGYSPNSISDPSVLAPGSILGGKYIVGKVIGKGGFGITYLAYDSSAGKKAAIKEFFPFGLAIRNGEPTVSVTTAENASVFKSGAERFYEEARLVSRFNGNPNIVGVHEFFYENDTVYFAMEYLDGQTLKSRIEKNGVLTPEQALFIAQNVSNALMAAHSAAVLHRDISPDNIMLCSNGEVKLIDFGAARQVVAEHSQSFSVILKPGFAPLEQYQKKGNQGTWTDIYSLGASLYYALTGDIPDDPMSRMEDDTTFSSNKYNIEPQMWEIITKATELKIADRYPDVFELRKAINRVAYKPQPIVAPTVQEQTPDIGFRTAMPYGSVRTTTNAAGLAGQAAQTSQNTQTMQTVRNVQQTAQQPAAQPVSAQAVVGQGEQNKTRKKLLIGAGIGGAAAIVAAAVIIAVFIGGGKDDVPVKNDSQITSQDTWSGAGTLNSDNDSSAADTTTSAPDSKPSEPDKPSEESTPEKTTTTKKPKKSSTPESTPETTPKTTPETTPETTPKTTPETTPETTTTPKTTTTTAPKESKPEEVTTIKIAGKSYSVDLTSLEITDKGLMNSDLKDIKYMKNLEVLILSNNNLTSIDFVKDLPNLKSLYFHDNEVKDLSPLKSLKNLREIGANNNPVSDISVLSGMTKLEKVWLCGTKVKDISVLKGRNLTEVGFNYCSISSSVSVLKDMSNLTIVSLSGCGLSNISFLANKTKLSRIYLSQNYITDASPLFGCAGIEELYMDHNTFDEYSVSSFFGLTVYGDVYVSDCGLTQEQADEIYNSLAGNPQTLYY